MSQNLRNQKMRILRLKNNIILKEKYANLAKNVKILNQDNDDNIWIAVENILYIFCEKRNFIE